MSVGRLLSLAEQLYAARTQATSIERDLRKELADTAEINQRTMDCNILAPDRTLWHLTWDSGRVSVNKTPVLDALNDTPAGRNAVEADERPVRHLLDF